MKAVIATRNPDKLKEIIGILSEVLSDTPIELVGEDELGPWDPPEEAGSTVEENALIKATRVSQQFGIPAIADDTALEVDALGGEPGVYSARYAGVGCTYKDNRTKVLEELKRRGKSCDRRARFRTVAVAVGFPGGTVISEGVVEGWISECERGSGGFGYDPIFVPEGFDKTFAEMSQDEKNNISHRGKAFRRLATELRLKLDIRDF